MMDHDYFCAPQERIGKPAINVIYDTPFILVLIHSLHQEWDGILGYRRMCVRLRQEHEELIGIRPVRRLMRSAGLSDLPKKRRSYQKPDRTDQNIPDLLQREFSAKQPNLAWVIDIFEFPT